MGRSARTPIEQITGSSQAVRADVRSCSTNQAYRALAIVRHIAGCETGVRQNPAPPVSMVASQHDHVIGVAPGGVGMPGPSLSVGDQDRVNLHVDVGQLADERGDAARRVRQLSSGLHDVHLEVASPRGARTGTWSPRRRRRRDRPGRDRRHPTRIRRCAPHTSAGHTVGAATGTTAGPSRSTAQPRRHRARIERHQPRTRRDARSDRGGHDDADRDPRKRSLGNREEGDQAAGHHRHTLISSRGHARA